MGTFGLGFNALPNVFAVMPAGRFFGFVWFLMLFLAAITSSISMLQPVIAFLEEGLGLRRHASVALLGLITALGSAFTMYFSKGLVALDTFDFWVGTLLIYLLAMFQTVLYGWVFGTTRGEEEMHLGAKMRVPRFIQIVLKYVAPAYLLIIFVAFCWQSLPEKLASLKNDRVALAAVCFIAIIAAFLLLLVHIAGKRWTREARMPTDRS
jgi:NSS family neurotransmitter:Na+ symporter